MLTYFYTHETITKAREYFHDPERFPCNLLIIPTPTTILRQPLLPAALQSSLQLKFYINGMIQYIFLLPCFWYILVILRFIHVVALVNSGFLLLSSIPLCGYATICLSIHPLIHIWVISSF